jgi:hypothetical protein
MCKRIAHDYVTLKRKEIKSEISRFASIILLLRYLLSIRDSRSISEKHSESIFIFHVDQSNLQISLGVILRSNENNSSLRIGEYYRMNVYVICLNKDSDGNKKTTYF